MNQRQLNPLTAAPRPRVLAAALWAVMASVSLSGCAVLAVADLAASVAVGAAGLAVDAAVGTAKIGGKVIGKTADVVLGSGEAAAE